jgi:hypothetical protein
LLDDNRTKLAKNNAPGARHMPGIGAAGLFEVLSPGRAAFLLFAAGNHIEFLCRTS